MKDYTRNYTDAIPYKDSYKDGSRSRHTVDYVRVWQPNTKPVTTERQRQLQQLRRLRQRQRLERPLPRLHANNDD